MLSGSSPRARGTHHLPPRVLVDDRFIPASAGNTTGCTGRRRIAPVHPRERGEHGGVGAGYLFGNGSSPRARGTHQPRIRGRGEDRFIPASAGNTSGGVGVSAPLPVHPRERGEHHASRIRDGIVSGSSPRARGTHGGRWGRRAGSRFIPASAGNTPGTGPCNLMISVHPRERGEHITVLPAPSTISGSSPRARGTLFLQETDSKPIFVC